MQHHNTVHYRFENIFTGISFFLCNTNFNFLGDSAIIKPCQATYKIERFSVMLCAFNCRLSQRKLAGPMTDFAHTQNFPLRVSSFFVQWRSLDKLIQNRNICTKIISKDS